MSFDDERIRFYFKHRDQIEEWAALRSAAAGAVDEWLLELASEVEALKAELGPAVHLHCVTGEDVPYPSYRLVSGEWNLGVGDNPPVCVALEWPRGRANLRRPNAPYVGVRAPSKQEAGIQLRASEAFRKVRPSRKDETSPWWAAFNYVLPDGQFPETHAAYRQALLAALRGVWDAYAPVIAQVVAPKER